MALGGGGSYGNNEVPNDTLSHPPPKAEVRTSEGQLGLTATMEVENPPNEIEVNLHVAKNRGGRGGGDVSFMFNRELTEFAEVEREKPE